MDGSITTAHDAELIKKVRRASKFLVAIGTCACSGGIQALRNFTDVNDFIKAVYAQPEYIQTLEQSTPLSAHVKVDYQLNGCPINKRQLLEVISAYLAGPHPVVRPHSVCLRMQAPGQHLRDGAGHPLPGAGDPRRAAGPCAPPTTGAATAATAPRRRPTPRRWPPGSAAAWGCREDSLVRAFRTFYANAPEFRRESEAHEK